MSPVRVSDLSRVMETDRLVLRPLREDDAPALAALAADYEVAAGVLTMPHPYSLSDAEAFIDKAKPYLHDSERPDHVFAVTLKPDGVLIGVIGLHEARPYRRAEMGYWIGRPYWNNGYASEAARRLLDYGFGALGLNRIHAACYTSNPGSARVMEKMGMTLEGTLRQQYIRFGTIRDVHVYGILRDEWERGQ